MSECQSCERGKHEECEGRYLSPLVDRGCDCQCLRDLDYAYEAARVQADLAYKAMRENQ